MGASPPPSLMYALQAASYFFPAHCNMFLTYSFIRTIEICHFQRIYAGKKYFCASASAIPIKIGH